jgi:hypothetical protein
MRRQRIPCLFLLAMLPACVMVPVTTERFNPECGQVARHMTLQPMQIAAITGCVNDGCAVLLAAAGVTAAASTVVSGTIAIVGNVVYWMEERGRCLRTGA